MGKLIIVPTPIGNLGDITFRAVEVLKDVDVVLAEDTRVTGRLLQHLGVSTRLSSFHAHNEHRGVPKVIERLQTGERIALVSDAGTPGISDPGFLLVRECVKEGIEVECLPGPSALIPALVVSGLPCDRFVFEGFLPQKKGRKTRLEALRDEPRTVVFYESPHRVEKLFQELCTIFGEERQASYSRELSKMYEETVRGTVKELHQHLIDKPAKGEFVVCVAGA